MSWWPTLCVCKCSESNSEKKLGEALQMVVPKSIVPVQPPNELILVWRMPFSTWQRPRSISLSRFSTKLNTNNAGLPRDNCICYLVLEGTLYRLPEDSSSEPREGVREATKFETCFNVFFPLCTNTYRTAEFVGDLISSTTDIKAPVRKFLSLWFICVYIYIYISVEVQRGQNLISP